MRKKRSANYLATAAIVAAIYAALTLLLSPISYGIMQVRLSEAMVILCVYTPAAVPGLFVGCFFANLMGTGGIVDAIFGSLATLLGALGIRALRKRPALGLLVNVVVNGIAIGIMLQRIYGLDMPLPVCMGWIALGELASCFVPGLLLKKLLDRRGKELGFEKL